MRNWFISNAAHILWHIGIPCYLENRTRDYFVYGYRCVEFISGPHLRFGKPR